MGILFKKNEEKKIVTEPGKLYAPIKGMYIPLSEIPDETFAKGYLGKGCGIEPDSEEVVSPANGIVSVVAETKHAVGITTEDGTEILIHVGMDTVDMNGEGFQTKVKMGDPVVCGQPLLKFNKKAIKKAGHPVTTAFIITNSENYSDIQVRTGRKYELSEEIGSVTKA